MEVQMYSCLDTEATGMPKHNATQLLQEQCYTKKGIL